ncbi:chain length determinant protein [Pontibacter sp. 13R65]|uniref:chain length determinant protein n=1 Tax=Pontibacter sp. 13R65 TaxID=3127458 RepID=UPI00301B9AF7
MYKEKQGEKKGEVTEQFHRDEVDLTFIVEKVIKGTKSAGNGISYIYNLILRKKLLLTGFMVFGIILSYIAHQATKPYYSSSMTFVLAKIRNDFVEEQLNGLESMVVDKNFEAIAERLDITLATAQQIKDMDFINLDEERITMDSVLTGSPFRIELNVYDNQVFSSLEPALTSYLENNRYFTRQKQIKEEQYRKMISKYRSDISSIDSIKGAALLPKGPVNGFIFGQPLDPTELYKQGIDMYKDQVELEAELDQLDNIQVVNGFVPRKNPSGPNLFLYLLAGAVLFLVLGLITASTLEKRKRKI